MHVLLLGARGLIGSAVATALTARGDHVTGVTRFMPELTTASHDWIKLDIARATPADWAEHLHVDAVINCAGVLQDGVYESTQSVHVDGAKALYAACEQVRVRRIVHMSAVGIDRATPTAFSSTKLAGDLSLAASNLDYVILRPSVVIGSGAYGASALMRGLASLPFRPQLPETGLLQPVHLDDLVQTILFFLRPEAPTRCIFDVVGPERLSFDDTVAMIRRWLGWEPARTVRVPASIATALYRLGDLISWLGWQPAVRTTARREIARGAIGSSAGLDKIGREIRHFETVLFSYPASVQERWFAQLYVLKPVVFVVLSCFWIGTGIISLTVGWNIGVNLMREGGANDIVSPLAIVGGAVADILIGAAIACRPLARAGLWSGIAISIAYALIGTALIPSLWVEPLGPMLKIFPIVVLHLMARAILESR
jgi:nucleoside-diphosphate-sugar epimerase